jgi:hypothetical protein
MEFPNSPDEPGLTIGELEQRKKIRRTGIAVRLNLLELEAEACLQLDGTAAQRCSRDAEVCVRTSCAIRLH